MKTETINFQKKFSKIDLNVRWSIVVIRFVLLITIASCFFIFRKFDQIENIKFSKNLDSILRKESSLSNSYALAKSLVDLEFVGIFKCAKLREVGSPGRVYYDSIEMGCNSESTVFDRVQNLKLIGINGNSYELSYIKKSNAFSLIVEVIIYLILFFTGFFLIKYLLYLDLANNVKLKALEIEKNYMLDLAKRARHDIAAPITVLNSVVALLTNVDPEVRKVLIDAIARTRMIFDDLNLNVEEAKNADLKQFLLDIIREKKFLWNDKILFDVEFDSAESPYYAIADEAGAKSIFSNILNNSFEAFYFSDTSCKKSPSRVLCIKVVTFLDLVTNNVGIKFSDNGPGIEEEIISQIGNRGFSFGKEHIQGAGTGLGIYSAKILLKKWGGNLEIQSKLEKGTEIMLTFRRSGGT